MAYMLALHYTSICGMPSEPEICQCGVQPLNNAEYSSRYKILGYLVGQTNSFI